MGTPIGSETRKDCRQAIGYNLGSIYVSEATSSGTTTSLIDNTLRGGTDDHKGKEIIMVSGTTANVGSKARVTSFDPNTFTLILNPALTSATADGDGYEMHKDYFASEIDNRINQAIIGASDEILLDKETHNTYKEEYKYEYDALSGFVALHKVEYEYAVKIDHEIHACDEVWDEEDNVTASLDTDNQKEGSGCLELEVALGCATGILATDVITSLDINDCDELVAWVWSDTALDANDLQILLGDEAECASTLEDLNIPAVSANTSTRVTISLANPLTDIDIISVGVKMVVDKDAFTFRIDDIRAQKTTSRIYRTLNPDFWGIVHATTPLLKLTEDGYTAIANNKRLRLNGYQIPSELSADATTCGIEPEYVVAKATGLLLASHAGGSQVDLDDCYRRSNFWLGIAEKRLLQARTSLAENTRWI